MTWRLFTKGILLGRVFYCDVQGTPAYLTPLYIASFSTAAGENFAKRGVALVQSVREAGARAANTQFLLSAYDLGRRLHYGHHSNREIASNELVALLNKNSYWHLDTGVYEQDFFEDESWSVEEYLSVYDATRPPSVVAFERTPSDESIEAFIKALSEVSGFLETRAFDADVTFLLKFHRNFGLWERDSSSVELDRIHRTLEEITARLESLGSRIAMLGVPEVQLGPGIRSRLRSLARLRIAMQNKGLEIPIHVFGVSDPQSMAFYCLAGADAFDGINWSRYYLDTQELCFRDRGLLSWHEPSLGEATSIERQEEMLAVRNLLAMQGFTARLRRLIEKGQPLDAQEATWISLVKSCCEDLMERSG